MSCYVGEVFFPEEGFHFCEQPPADENNIDSMLITQQLNHNDGFMNVAQKIKSIMTISLFLLAHTNILTPCS